MTLHMRKNYNCHIQMIKRCLKLIHKSLSLILQVEADNQNGILVLHSLMAWLLPQMTDLQTRLPTKFITYFSFFLLTLMHISYLHTHLR